MKILLLISLAIYMVLISEVPLFKSKKVGVCRSHFKMINLVGGPLQKLVQANSRHLGNFSSVWTSERPCWVILNKLQTETVYFNIVG